MHPYKPFQKASIFSLVLGAALFLAQLKCEASPTGHQEQQQSQQQQPPPTPPAPQAPPSASPQAASADQPVAKQRKVWTNDNVITLRTPADNYELEKEEKEAAEAASAAKEAVIRASAKSDKKPPLDIKLPNTVEATQKMVEQNGDDIHEITVILNKMHTELQSASEAEKPDKQKEIDRLSESLATSQRNLKALQDHLQELSLKQQKANPPSPPAPTSFPQPPQGPAL